MLKNWFTSLLIMMFLFFPSIAKASWTHHVPQSEEVGTGKLKYLFWDVYNATLYAPNGSWNKDEPFALKLTYLRNIKGTKIADKTIEEIRKQKFNDEVQLATWHTQLRKIFPNVKKNLNLIGVYTDNKTTLFYKDNQKIGEIKDPLFGEYFFNIWLGEQTKEPVLRDSLLRK